MENIISDIASSQSSLVGTAKMGYSTIRQTGARIRAHTQRTISAEIYSPPSTKSSQHEISAYMKRSGKPIRLKGPDLIPDVRDGGGFTFKYIANKLEGEDAREQKLEKKDDKDPLQVLFESSPLGWIRGEEH